ncbi:MAG: SDR family oxidoreductase [Mycobacterium sp.]
MTSATTALVTGANKGIGLAAVRELAGLGWTVLLGARDEGRGIDSVLELTDEGLDVRFVHLDVTDPQSVEVAAKWVDFQFGHLDVLVNNAGINLDQQRPPSQTTAELVRDTSEVNVVGLVRVTHALLPLLRRSPAPRIVNVSSSGGSITIMGSDQAEMLGASQLAYGSSKAAVNAITAMYARELRTAGFKVNAVNPGWVATDLNGHSGPKSPADAAKLIAAMATLGDHGPTGLLHEDTGVMPW